MELFSKLRFPDLRHRWPWSILVILFRSIGFICPEGFCPRPLSNTLKLFGFPILSVPDEGYRAYLIKVIERTWWRLLSVTDEGYWAYLMKVTERTWWRLLQKGVICSKFDINLFIPTI